MLCPNSVAGPSHLHLLLRYRHLITAAAVPTQFSPLKTLTNPKSRHGLLLAAASSSSRSSAAAIPALFTQNPNEPQIPPPFTLLGPPEIRRLSPPSSAADGGGSGSIGDPFTDLMDANFSCQRPYNMGRTDNRSPTFLSSGNPCLDFFFHVVPGTGPETLTDLLSKAWAQDPLTALKLVCNLRGVHGTGKSDREGFYTSSLWLHGHHPKTLALNVPSFAEFGYVKDLLEILCRILHGPDVARQRRAKQQGTHDYFYWLSNGKRREKKGSGEERAVATVEKMKVEMEKAAELRRARRQEDWKKGVERYARDLVYRFLHDRVSEFFADHLVSDLENLRVGNMFGIGLAAKWCPTVNSAYDRSTLICESIARRIWPKDSCDEYREIEEEHYAYRIRDRLRKEVLTPIRKALELPEVYIGVGRWDILPYNRVASVAMKNYTELFKKHDEKRFLEFLSNVKKGKAKIAAGALLPHQIVASVYAKETSDVAELQWDRMVQDLLGKGKLKNCIAVCDVSGSMRGTPMHVCVALGLLVSELSEEPWKGRVITFSESPQLHKIEGESLLDKMKFVENMQWDLNTNFQKVFDRIMEVAKDGNLDEDKMIKRVFVFSDMEFDEASANEWETDYEAICRKFQESGYGSCVPEIVFWNLRDSRSTPVPSTQKGVALVSGFSKNLVKVFLEGDGVLNPEDTMIKAISGKEYEKLVVFD